MLDTMATSSEVGLKKRLGAFYTPEEIAVFLARWALRQPHDTVLDPGCGEGVFLMEAYRRLTGLGAKPGSALSQVYGVELEPRAYQRALGLFEAETGKKPPHVLNLNFFETGTLFDFSLPRVSAVIGNPPYIRYHRFNGAMRASALKAAAHHGTAEGYGAVSDGI
jgi:adenine-specific DNA-methyltransferase